ncbi:hypothetical protein J5O02_07635 [Streptococcus suis]|uniref:AbiH family protein n=1 Tax=Streptococcus suis TaxID=1307 RepID=UPI000CF66BA6|nr:AbiH family protein [Streptococcus suis]MBO3756918.1 hypothetical protein [Streptococcus suis]
MGINNIVILGNGFDLSLGLKTSYADFIKFVDRFTELIIEQSKKINDTKNNSWTFENNYVDIIYSTFGILNNRRVKSYDAELHEGKDFFLAYFPEYKDFEAISKNTFIQYLKFLQKKSDVYETNWNNIERAIMELAEAIEYLIENVGQTNVVDFLYNPVSTDAINSFKSFSNYLAFCFIEEHFKLPLKNSEDHSDLAPIKEINKQLLDELDYLTLLLEFYLIYVQKKQFKTIQSTAFTDFLNTIGNKKVITFNYTQTAEEIFKDLKSDDIHYIHGSVRTGEYSRIYKKNNMIFGIEDRKVTEINSNVIGYQKFYQRILKQTGSRYESFFSSKPETITNVIIFGHSVDPVDKEIFTNIFEILKIDNGSGKNPRVIIMYHDEQAKREIIKNLATILGKDRLIRLTGQEKLIFNHSTDMQQLSKILLPIHIQK